MRRVENIRVRNPFHGPLVTEVLEDPARYGRVFSERILVGETIEVFQPVNVVLVGPQGSGKSMILNLIRSSVLSEWITRYKRTPEPLRHIPPYFGISVNLVRANFHAFGRRSVSKTMGRDQKDEALDATCAADFLNHYLFRECLKGLELLGSSEGRSLQKWLGVQQRPLDLNELARTAAKWDCWFGYYASCRSFKSLQATCEKRLVAWRSFLNANTDEVPEDIWKTKSPIGDPLHAMGNLLASMVTHGRAISLFVVIDQYEVLPELNPAFGTMLQRIINTLIKARDPVVFYKVGARTHDWGKELKVWGADSRIEVQRDYIIVNLNDVLMRNEDSKSWLFQSFATDVARRRIVGEGRYRGVKNDQIQKILGGWTPEAEAQLYFRDRGRNLVALRGTPDAIKEKIKNLISKTSWSPLELRLAAAWALQKRRKGHPESWIVRELESRPWRKTWWRKERIGVALLQIASLANQKKLYYGWKTVLYLSGGNISVFLLLCEEIWDAAAKLGIDPMKKYPLKQDIQSDAIHLASEKWLRRDREETVGGRQRYEVLCKLGPSIHEALKGDLGISNPGHSGFSLKESDLVGDERKNKVAEFLNSAVNWAIMEERVHTSKLREGVRRRKWYLHPLLSPVFSIPHIRVKEPYYASLDEVYRWIFDPSKPVFGSKKRYEDAQPTLFPMEELE